MIGLFNLVPSWLYAAIIAALVATNCATSVRLDREKLAHQTSKTEYAERVASAEKQRADEESKRRQTEKDLQDAQDAHAQEVAAVLKDRDAARANGRVVADRVRDAARATAEIAGQVCTNSTTARVRETASLAADLLADLRERADETAGILARSLDDSHFAGSACARRYDEVRQAVNQ
jgi:hypothetical protein